VSQFAALRRQVIRIGTQDLRIAAICLTQQAILACCAKIGQRLWRREAKGNER
jgi:predicted nucleic acid-binding protein